MTTGQRLDRFEDELADVKQLLGSAARYAESANRGLDRLTAKIDDLTVAASHTQTKIDELTEVQARTQTQINDLTVAASRTQTQLDQLTQVASRLDRDAQASAADFAHRIVELWEEAERDRAKADEDRAKADEDRAFMRGLQTENRRILDYLINRNGGSNLP